MTGRSLDDRGVDTSTSAEAAPNEAAVLESCRRELELKSALLDSIGDGIIAHTADGQMVYANHQAADMLGYELDDLLGMEPWGWVAPDARHTIPERLRLIRDSGTLVYETQLNTSGGGVLSVEVLSRLVQIEPWGELLINSKRDMSPRWAVQEQMRQLAFFDPLTGLGNRTLLESRLGSALSGVSAGEGQVGVIFMDLDDFKPVNDTHGHAVGDRVLRIIAERMANCVRDTDTVARIGGDEFVALFPDLTSERDLCVKARRIADAVADPIVTDGLTVRVSVSVGLAIYQTGEHHDELLRRADHAMYRAKSHGRPGWDEFPASL